MPIFCNQCKKDVYFDNLPTDRSIFCPDCGSPATIIDSSELFQRKNSKIASNNMVESPTAVKTGSIDPFNTKKTEPYNPHVTKKAATKKTEPHRRTKYSRRKALILSSLGAIIGITGIGHLYIRTSKNIIKGICFLIGGFFVYLLTVVGLDVYILHPVTGSVPNGEYGVVFFLIVYILIWLWQFLDIGSYPNTPRDITLKIYCRRITLIIKAMLGPIK